jgi:hypothetical protein
MAHIFVLEIVLHDFFMLNLKKDFFKSRDITVGIFSAQTMLIKCIVNRFPSY